MKDRYWIDERDTGTYWKKLDSSPPEIFYKNDVFFKGYFGKIFKPFLNGECLLILKQDFLTIVPILHDFSAGESKKIFLKDNSKNSDILSFGDKIIILTRGGNISFFKGRMKGKKVKIKELNNLKLNMLPRYGSEFTGISICDQDRYIMISQISNMIATGLLVYEIRRENLVFRRELDIQSLCATEFFQLNFVRYFEDRAYFCALGYEEDEAPLMSFYFDGESEEICEDSELKEDVDVGYVYRFVKRSKGVLEGITLESRRFVIKYE